MHRPSSSPSTAVPAVDLPAAETVVEMAAVVSPNQLASGSTVREPSSAVAASGFSPAADPRYAAPLPSLSVVIPMFNAARTVAGLVEEIFHEFVDERIEVILVNDGSADATDAVARRIVDLHGGRVVYVELARNYGEHSAVLAGLELARGRHVAVIDDDGQNPPAEIRRLRDTAVARGRDVVYGRYLRRRHNVVRRALSGLHNWAADRLVDKPRGLYLSSFKVLNRFAVDQICRSAGPRPHLDGLILRLTREIDEVDVLHRPRRHGRSGYTPAKLARLWLDFVVGHSSRLFVPALLSGTLLAFAGAVCFLALLGTGRASATGCMSCAIAAGMGMVLFYLGLIGESLIRAADAAADRPPYVVRSLYRGDDPHA